MWTLTGFADEIALDLADQIKLLTELKVGYIEFRSAWGVKILDMTQDQLDEAKRQLDAAGIKVSSIGSDLGKIGIDDDFEPHLERAKHAVEVAKFFDAPYIRIFSFFVPQDADPAPYRDEVLRRMNAMVAVAEGSGVTMLHENEKEIYGDVPERVVDIFENVSSDAFGGIFDPSNYVQCKTRPFDEAYPLVREYTDYLHIKDAVAGEIDKNGLEKVVPAGEGDGQVRELLAAFRDSGFDGFLSLEPHLAELTLTGALSGPGLWATAHAALVKILDELGIEYR